MVNFSYFAENCRGQDKNVCARINLCHWVEKKKKKAVLKTCSSIAKSLWQEMYKHKRNITLLCNTHMLNTEGLSLKRFKIISQIVYAADPLERYWIYTCRFKSLLCKESLWWHRPQQKHRCAEVPASAHAKIYESSRSYPWACLRYKFHSFHTGRMVLCLTSLVLSQ